MTNTVAARNGQPKIPPVSKTGSDSSCYQCFVVAAGAVLAAGAMAFVAGAAAVEAAGAAVDAAGADEAAFSVLLQAARAQAKAAAERTTRYFFMLITTRMCGGRRKLMILLDDLNANRAIGREF